MSDEIKTLSRQEINLFDLQRGQLHIKLSLDEGRLYSEALQFLLENPVEGLSVGTQVLIGRDFTDPTWHFHSRSGTYNTSPLTKEVNPDQKIRIPTPDELKRIFSEAKEKDTRGQLDQLVEDLSAKQPPEHLGTLLPNDRKIVIDAIKSLAQ